jgi:hypothetical protein
MKKTALIFGIISLMIISFGCSEKDNTGNDNPIPDPPVLAQEPDIVMTFPPAAELVNFESTLVEYGGEMVTAYSLPQFLDFDRAGVDELEYTYEIVSDDGYSPRQGGNPDLFFQQFETGYLLPDNSFRSFFPSDDIANAYNVKWAETINLYRTIVVVDAEGTEITVQLGAFELVDVYHQAGNGQFYTDPGFSLTNLISDYVTANPENYEYHLSASDDYSLIFSWQDIQAAWWLPEQNKAVFLNEDGTEFHSSFKYLIRAELVTLP